MRNPSFFVYVYAGMTIDYTQAKVILKTHRHR